MINHNKDHLYPRVIAISSGKGGTGKTFFSVNLASLLQKKGKNVLLLDGDFGLANIHLLLGEQPEKNLDSVLRGECSLEEILLTTQEGFTIIPGGRGQSSLAHLKPTQLSGLISLGIPLG